MTPLEPLPVASAGFKPAAHAAYRRLRAEQPVCRVALSRREEAFLLVRYDDVSTLLTDGHFAKDAANAMTPEQLARLRRPPAILAPLLRNMLGLDDPDHARLKRLVQAAFTPRRVAGLAARTQATADALLDRLGAGFDLVADFAMPLPVTVISDLLGVPDRDRARFARWSRTLIGNTMTPLSILRSLPDMLAFVRYLKTLIALKRAAPGDDLVSDLVDARAAERLDEDELAAMIAILLSAGHETTTNLIGNATLALLADPEARHRLSADPALMQTALEELLRFAGPVDMSTHRYAREDLEIAGERIPRGSLVLGVIASANRDERQFENPDRLDFGRTRNRHLTFGEGGHYCVGAALARLEGGIALTTLLARMPNLRLRVTPDRLRWRAGLVLRGVVAIPVERGHA